MIESWLDGLMLAAPILILAASFLDTWMVTGYFLYGFALMGSVGVMHVSGMISAPEIILMAWIGTASASIVNFTLGHLGRHVSVSATPPSDPSRLARIQMYIRNHPLWLAILIGRSISITRPLYGFILGTAHVSPVRFVAWELPISLVWVCFWITVIILGEHIVLELL